MNNTENFNNTNIRLKAIRRSYDFPQPEFPIGVKEYLLTTVSEQRCCVIRWINRLEHGMDSMTFELVELDIDGNELGDTVYTLDKGSITQVPTEDTFATNRVFPIDSKCAYVKVLFKNVVSGDYTYRMEPDGMEVDYRLEDNYWKYEEEHPRKPKPMRKTRKKHYKYQKKFKKRRVVSKRGMRVRLLRLFMIFTLLLILIVIISPLLAKINFAPINWIGKYFS